MLKKDISDINAYCNFMKCIVPLVQYVRRYEDSCDQHLNQEFVVMTHCTQIFDGSGPRDVFLCGSLLQNICTGSLCSITAARGK